MKKLKLDVLLFLAVISLFGIFSILNPNKATISLQENRKLAEKPKISLKTLADASFFTDFEEYYSDTVLFRENMIQANVDIKKHMGSGADDISITVIGTQPPKASNTPAPSKKPEQDTATPTPTQTATTTPDNTQAPTEPETSEPQPDEPTGGGAATGMYITVGGETFKLDDYSEEAYDNYAEYINKIAKMAGSDMKVYSMLAPSRSTYLALTKYDFLSSRAANVEQINSKIDKSVTNVNVLRSMVEHVDEYIYYRTDHHWTHLGAYYGYVELMKAMGRENEIVSLDEYTDILEIPGYLGYYNKPYLTQADYDNPDTIIAYYPIVDYTYTYHWGEASYEKRLLNDKWAQPDSDYYRIFSDGGFGTHSVLSTDNPNGKVAMVIKDSFGDSLVSWLLPHYKEVYVIDSRTYDKSLYGGLNLIEFAKSKNVDDFIVNYWITEITYIDDFMAIAYSTLE